MLTDMDAFVFVKERRGMHDNQAVSFNIHKHFLSPDHVARQATEIDGKLQNSHYDDARKTWDEDKYIGLHKEQHAIMKSLKDYGYSGMDNDIKVHHFLQGIKSPELEAVVNVVCAQLVKYSTDFDALVSYLGQMVTKKAWSCNQSRLYQPKIS